MAAGSLRISTYIATVTVLLAVLGCGESDRDKKGPIRQEFEKSKAKIESGMTIGQVAEVFSPDFLPVQGYAIVGELAGTGSADCPPSIREHLRQYILRHMPGQNVDQFINSAETAVVIAEGLMPTSSRGATFDVRVAAPGAAQTSSLEHGQLYGAELRAAGSFGLATKALAYVEGPVYIDKIDGVAEKTVGYILGGGRVLDNYKMMLSLREPDYLVANAVRNKLIERFGSGAAKALSPGQIELQVPAQYSGRKQHFISVLKATYLSLSSDDRRNKISEFAAQLTGGGDSSRLGAEIALEAIGKDSLGALRNFLDSTDADVQFRAARCMLNLGSDEGLDILRRIALEGTGDRRTEALEAIAAAAKRNDASSVCRRLLRDADIEVRLAAYEQLSRMDDIAVSDELIGRNFYLEQITLAREKLIFVSRSGRPRIAIFGGPVYCKGDLFIQSADGNITLNAPPGQDYVTVIRTIEGRGEIPPVSLNCSYKLSDIIRTLGSEPTRRRPTDRVGLGASYSDIVALLNRMVEKGAIDCRFRAGPTRQITLK